MFNYFISLKQNYTCPTLSALNDHIYIMAKLLFALVVVTGSQSLNCVQYRSVKYSLISKFYLFILIEVKKGMFVIIMLFEHEDFNGRVH